MKLTDVRALVTGGDRFYLDGLIPRSVELGAESRVIPDTLLPGARIPYRSIRVTQLCFWTRLTTGFRVRR